MPHVIVREPSYSAGLSLKRRLCEALWLLGRDSNFGTSPAKLSLIFHGKNTPFRSRLQRGRVLARCRVGT